MEKTMEKMIARVSETSTGSYVVSNDDWDYVDERGKHYPTRAMALRGASVDYTHYINNGKILRIPLKYRL